MWVRSRQNSTATVLAHCAAVLAKHTGGSRSWAFPASPSWASVRLALGPDPIWWHSWHQTSWRPVACCGDGVMHSSMRHKLRSRAEKKLFAVSPPFHPWEGYGGSSLPCRQPPGPPGDGGCESGNARTLPGEVSPRWVRRTCWGLVQKQVPGSCPGSSVCHAGPYPGPHRFQILTIICLRVPGVDMELQARWCPLSAPPAHPWRVSWTQALHVSLRAENNPRYK